MNLSKSIIVAKADFKAAMTVRFVKYGLLGLGAMGPIMAILTVLATVLLVPPGPDYELLILFIGPTVASLLMMFGMIPASMISANALVGEREQRTLEPLLATPLTDRELLVGKMLSSLIPSAILLYGGTVASIIVENAVFLILGRPLLLIPDFAGMFLVFVGGPLMIIGIVSFMILISGRVSRVYEAYQTTGVVVLIAFIPMFVPMTFMEAGLDANTIWLTNIVTVLIAAVFMCVTFLLAITRFNRDRLISMV